MRAVGTDGDRLHVALVLEGGRSRADAADLAAVAQALEQSGVTVHVIRHGLGRLSALQVQRAVQRVQPQVLITTGVTSSRHLRRIATRLGCPLVCYFWPSASVVDPHRRPAKRSPEPLSQEQAEAEVESVALQHAVFGSQQQRAELLQARATDPSSPRLLAARMHVLPPLLDVAIFAPPQGERSGTPSAPRSELTLGVYGATPPALRTLSPGLQVISLDGAPTRQSADASEAQRLSACDGLVVIVHDALDAREAARRSAVALVLGKPTLLVGFGASRREVPAEIQSLDPSPALLRAVSEEELPQELPRFCAQLRAQAGSSVPASADQPAAQHRLREALHPAQVLAEHVALIFEIAALASAPIRDQPVSKPPSLSLHAKALGLRFSRQPQQMIVRYQAVVSELRGFDPDALISIQTLEKQLQTLLAAGYQAVPLSALAAMDRSAPQPVRRMAVTFDGGHAGVALLAAPLLGRLRIPFTVFVATDLLVPDPLWPWPELIVRALRDPVARAQSLPLLVADPSLSPFLTSEPAHWPKQAQRLRQMLAGWPAPRRSALVDALRVRLRDHLGAGPRPGHTDAWAPLLPKMVPTIRNAGGDLGSHGCSLSPFASLDDAALAAELAESRRAVRALAGTCDALAPPPLSGPAGVDARTVTAAAAAGYLHVVSSGVSPGERLAAGSAWGRLSLSERSSSAPDGTFDAHRLWLSLTGASPR